MKPHLMFADADLDLSLPVFGADDLMADLELGHLLAAMAQGDRFLWEVSQAVLLHPITDRERIRYRQDVLRDCLEHTDIARRLFAIGGDALAREKKFWLGSMQQRPESVVRRSVQVLTMFLEELVRLRHVAEEHHAEVSSTGMTALMAALMSDLDDVYIAEVRGQLAQLGFRNGVRLSARIGAGNEGTDYLLHANGRASWRERLPWVRGDALSFQIAERDIAGMQALGEIRDRVLQRVAAALGDATQHLLDFFKQLRVELAFYLACANLHQQLTERGGHACVPDPQPSGRPALAARGLYDPSLRLLAGGDVVGNDLDAEHAAVIVITGANRGGKSTLLRALGAAQLMMQSGMFVAADSFAADVRTAVFTHFKHEEDASLTSGKLDEELRRLRSIVDHLTPGAVLLSNESLASTNEQEGSQIARAIITTLRDAGIKVVVVTHLYDLAHRLHAERHAGMLFLRAQPPSAAQPFVVVPGSPEPTSHGAEIYEKVFGVPPDPEQAPGPSSTALAARRSLTGSGQERRQR